MGGEAIPRCSYWKMIPRIAFVVKEGAGCPSQEITHLPNGMREAPDDGTVERRSDLITSIIYQGRYSR